MSSRKQNFIDRDQTRQGGGYNRGGGRGRGRGRGGRGGSRRDSYEQKSRDDTGQAPLKDLEEKSLPPPEPSFKMNLQSFPSMNKTYRPEKNPSWSGYDDREKSEDLPPILEIPVTRSLTSSSYVQRTPPTPPPRLSDTQKERIYERDLQKWSISYNDEILDLYENFVKDKRDISLDTFTRFMYETSE